MRGDYYKKSLVIGTFLTLILVGYGSVVQSVYTPIRIEENNNSSNSKILVNVRFIDYSEGIKDHQISLSRNDALNIIGKINNLYNKEISYEDMLFEQLAILESYRIIENADDVISLFNLENIDDFEVADNDYFNPYFFGLTGLGWTYPIGSHSVFGPDYSFGLDVLLPFVGLFGATTFSLENPPVRIPYGPVFVGMSFGFVGFVIDFGVVSSSGIGLFGPYLIVLGINLFGPPITVPPIKDVD